MQVILGIGAVLGGLYAAFGQLPAWLVEFSGGSITDDDDPSNIPARVYLPILLFTVIVAIVAFFVVIRFL